MAIQSFQLDPNASAYTADDVVAKVNSATAQITRADAVSGAALGDCDADDLGSTATRKWAGTTGADFVKASDDLDDVTSGATNKHFTATDEGKLDNVESAATTDQTGNEIVSQINAGASAITREAALSQDDLNIVKTNPAGGEYKVKNIHRDAAGKLDLEYDDTAV